MNVNRFSARTSREALAQVRAALGEDAVVLSTRPTGDGVEVLAMAPEGLEQAQAAAVAAPVVARAPSAAPVAAAVATLAKPRGKSLAERIAERGEQRQGGGAGGKSRAPAQRTEPRLEAGNAGEIDPSVARDVETLGMSTLSFQDYVRERMLRRRQAEMEQREPSVAESLLASSAAAPVGNAALRVIAGRAAAAEAAPATPRAGRRDAPVLHDEIVPAQPSAPARLPQPIAPLLADDEPPAPRLRAVAGRAARDAAADSSASGQAAREGSAELMGELRQVRQLIEERFGMLAYLERMQRDPRQVGLLQKLFDTGLSPGMVRKLVQGLPADVGDEMAWAAGVLEANLHTGDNEPALEDHQGVLALIGPTGVGKTTTTAKIAAACAARHGAANLGLVTLDAYRIGAQEQLRTYGRILGVPVHTAHDRASLEDLLELLTPKRLVLVDTAGVAQRDARTRDLLEMLSHRAIEKLLVVNAASQGETIEDVMLAYGSALCKGVVLSKLDEAVKLGPAIDALIRQRGKVLGVANGQRVPEDWHRLSANALVQRALRGGGSTSWRLDANEVNLVFAATHGSGYPGQAGGLRAS